MDPQIGIHFLRKSNSSCNDSQLIAEHDGAFASMGLQDQTSPRILTKGVGEGKSVRKACLCE